MSDVREMLPDYLLNLLENEERQRIDQALEGSPELRRELGELKAILLQIPEQLSPVLPPPSTWNKIQTRIRPRPDWPRWAAVAAVLALLLVGGWGLNQYRLIRNLEAEQTKIAQWVAIPKAHWRSFGSPDKTYGTMIWLEGQCYVVMEQPAPKGKAYQVWGRKEDDVPVSLGVFDGRTFETKYTGYKSVGVSLEPSGGSPLPTHPLGRVVTEKEKSGLSSPLNVNFTPVPQPYFKALNASLGPSGTNPNCL